MISFFNAINTYTDASVTTDASGKTVTCAGYVTVFQREIIDSGIKIVHNTTNNYGEILAIYMGVISLLQHKDYDAFLNLFSDSKISVCGLKEWIYSWVRDMDPRTRELYNSSRVPVSNQEIFCNIVNCIVQNNTHMSIFHQRGHRNPDKVDEMEEVRNTFMQINGTEITDDIIREICYYNDMVDNMTRNHLLNEVNNPEYNSNKFSKPTVIVSRVLDFDIMKRYKNLVS